MTYTLALRAPFGVAIISDRRITNVADGTWRDSGCKTGLIGTDVIYGLSGHLKNARETIVSLNTLRESDTDVTAWWDYSRKMLAALPVQTGDAWFAIQIGFLDGNAAELWLYESDHGMTRLEGHSSKFVVFSLGSGKDLFDDQLPRIVTGISRMSETGELKNWAIPYTLAFNLTCITTSYGQAVSDRVHVGGVFDFVVVDGLGARYQEPSLYAIANPNLRTGVVEITMYRVSSIGDYTAIETLHPPNEENPDGERKTTLFTDSGRTGSYEVPDIDKTNIRLQLDVQPFYKFCGVGFAHADLLHVYSVHSGGNGEPWAIGSDGSINPSTRAWIVSALNEWSQRLRRGRGFIQETEIDVAPINNVG